MKTLFIGCLLAVVIIGSGCASKSDKQARQRAAILAAQQQQAAAMQQQVNSSAVWVTGNVRNPSIPWTVKLWKTPLKRLGNLAMLGGIIGVTVHYLRYGSKVVKEQPQSAGATKS